MSGKVIAINRAVNRRQASAAVVPSPLPYLEQTEDWIELAQRFPVVIEFDEPAPRNIPIGASACVLIHRS
jgi:multidrug resistance efflux pump